MKWILVILIFLAGFLGSIITILAGEHQHGINYTSSSKVSTKDLSSLPSSESDIDNGNLVAQAVIKPLHIAIISSQISAKISQIPFREGQAFKKGDALINFDCRIIKSQLKKAQAALEGLQSEYQANLRLSIMRAVSNVDLVKSKTDVEEAKAEVNIQSDLVSYCQIKAPYPGSIVDIIANEQENAEPGQKLLEILDNSSLDIELIIPSTWFNWLKIGTPFDLYITETGKNYRAKIIRILPKVDAVSQSVKVIGQVLGSTNDLIAGMNGKAEFQQNSNLGKP